MILNLNNDFDREKFKTRSEFLLEKRTVVELTEKKGRSLSQNNYLHLIITIFALEVGESIEYVKQYVFKRHVNPDLFIREKDDKIIGKVEVLRSSADLTKEEMVTAIDRFKFFANTQCGIFIPDAISHEDQLELLRQIDRNKNYL
jgi:hypothetical protein